MRTRPDQSRAESRVVSRYHKLHEPLIELIQSLEDLLPVGVQLGETVELSSADGELSINYEAKPVRIVLRDKDQTVVLTVQKPPATARKRTATKTSSVT